MCHEKLEHFAKKPQVKQEPSQHLKAYNQQQCEAQTEFSDEVWPSAVGADLVQRKPFLSAIFNLLCPYCLLWTILIHEMKKITLLLLLQFIFLSLFSFPRLQPLEDYMLLGEFDLYTSKDFQNTPIDRTLNHEGGIKVKIIETNKIQTINNISGQWIKIKLNTSVWLESGKWQEKNSIFWIFLTEDIISCPIKE